MKNDPGSPMDPLNVHYQTAPHLRLIHKIISIYGISSALVLAEISSRWYDLNKKNKLINGYFYITQEKIKKITKINYGKQTSIIEQFINDGIINTQKYGMPLKKWYKLNCQILSQKIGVEHLGAPHLRLNKEIIRSYGIPISLWLADVYSKWHYFKGENKLINGYFYVSQKEIKETTLLCYRKQTEIIQEMCNEKIISMKRKGIPPKNWYKINNEILVKKIIENPLREANEIQYPKKVRYCIAKSVKGNCCIAKSEDTVSQNSKILYPKKVRYKRNKNITTKKRRTNITSREVVVFKKTPFEKISTSDEVGGLKNKTPSCVSKSETLSFFSEINKIFSFWNILPDIVKHKKIETKIYKTISSRLENMLKGYSLLKNKDNSIRKELLKFIEDNNIPEEIYLKKWEVEEITNILQMITDINSSSKRETGKPVKLSLDTILWNPFPNGNKGGFSNFLFTATGNNIPEEVIELSISLQEVLEIDIDTSQVMKWDFEFNNMVTKDKIDIQTIQNVIDWYKSHRGGEFDFQIRDAAEFRKKYNKLSEKMNKPSNLSTSQQNNYNQPSQKNSQPQQLTTQEDLHLYHYQDLEEHLEIYHELVNNCINRKEIWKCKPDRHQIFRAVVAMKQFMNNVLVCNSKYDWQRIKGVFKEFVLFLDGDHGRSYQYGIRNHSYLFPGSDAFNNFVEWHGRGEEVRCRGWGKDKDIPMLLPAEVLIKEAEKKKREQAKIKAEIKAEKIQDEKIDWMMKMAREKLSDNPTDKTFEVISSNFYYWAAYSEEGWKEDFLKFLDKTEKIRLAAKKNEQGLLNRSKGYIYLFYQHCNNKVYSPLKKRLLN